MVKHKLSGYYCSECDEKFKSESEWNQHRRDAHGWNPSGSYVCPACEERFRLFRDAFHHCRTFHGLPCVGLKRQM